MSTKPKVTDARLAEICLAGGHIDKSEVESIAWELWLLRKHLKNTQKPQPMHGQDDHG